MCIEKMEVLKELREKIAKYREAVLIEENTSRRIVSASHLDGLGQR